MSKVEGMGMLTVSVYTVHKHHPLQDYCTYLITQTVTRFIGINITYPIYCFLNRLLEELITCI